MPRTFLPGAPSDAPFELPQPALDKLRKVLRLQSGDPFAVLPDDGSLIVCRLEGREAIPERVERPDTEPRIHVTLAQALPKGDRLETVVRMGTEIGVSRFVMFPADRSVVRWEPSKLSAKLKRLEAIIRESAEQCYRTRLPKIEALPDLKAVLSQVPDAIVLSELEGLSATLTDRVQSKIQNPESEVGPQSAIRNPQSEITLVVGPEGGWSPKELAVIGDRGVTLGPLVLRTDTAGPAAAAALLLL
ncbi:MAG: 16S rRNA (uracil(1498)-N(3))-methyltransferase [Armatimonadetes bacterium]|nr:16S rRNA (uracil(1498)-N(3))-methyltransferase [Armatimonadota bacterium]